MNENTDNSAALLAAGIIIAGLTYIVAIQADQIQDIKRKLSNTERKLDTTTRLYRKALTRLSPGKVFDQLADALHESAFQSTIKNF